LPICLMIAARFRLSAISRGVAAARPLPTAASRMLRMQQLSTPASSHQDAYQVLGASRTASADELKALYKALAREWHPDRHQGASKKMAEDRFQQISEAFQLLSDEEQRAAYDSDLASATDAASRAAAANKYRARSWNTHVPNLQDRIRSQKTEEPTFSKHMMAGSLLLVTGNFVLIFHWLAG